MRKTLALLLTLLLVACNLPRPMADVPTAPPTNTSSYQNCYYNWATQPLPDLSKKVQAAMDSAGLKGVTAKAEAFGENCIDAQTLKVVGFGAMETDFRVAVEVPDLTNRDELGNLLERILIVLDEFSTGSTSGLRAGYVGVRFKSGDQELNLWFLVDYEKTVRGQGLHGAELVEKLMTK